MGGTLDKEATICWLISDQLVGWAYKYDEEGQEDSVRLKPAAGCDDAAGSRASLLSGLEP